MEKATPVISRKTTATVVDYFDYFDGGKNGVLNRVARKVEGCLADMPLSAIDLIAEHAGLETTSGLLRLVKERPTELSRNVIERLSERLNFDIRDSFGPIAAWDANNESLRKAAEENGFTLVAAADGQAPNLKGSPKEMLTLFAFLRAYRAL